MANVKGSTTVGVYMSVKEATRLERIAKRLKREEKGEDKQYRRGAMARRFITQAMDAIEAEWKAKREINRLTAKRTPAKRTPAKGGRKKVG